MPATPYKRCGLAFTHENDHRDWSADHLSGRITKPVRHNGLPYQGLNIILLWAACVDQGYGSNQWMTYKQAKELGGHVRKGAKGELVVYASTLERTETADNGEEVERKIPYMKGYTVFNVDGVDAPSRNGIVICHTGFGLKSAKQERNTHERS